MRYTVEVLKRQRISDRVAAQEISVGGEFTVPSPVFHVSVGESERAAVVMPPGRNIEPTVDRGGIKKMSVVDR